MCPVYGSSNNTSGIYGTIAVIFFFQGFYAFAIPPLTSLYATEVAPYKLRATAIAIFRAFDAASGYVNLLCNIHMSSRTTLLIRSYTADSLLLL